MDYDTGLGAVSCLIQRLALGRSDTGCGSRWRAAHIDGLLALVWTEVVSWGQDPFEDGLAEVFGHPWEKRLDHVDGSLQPIRDDVRFDEIQVRHHVFERSLDAGDFVAVTKTYGGHRSYEQYESIAKVIDDDFGVMKVEDATLYTARRR